VRIAYLSCLIISLLSTTSLAQVAEPGNGIDGVRQSLLAQTEMLRYADDPAEFSLLMPASLLAGVYERRGFRPYWADGEAVEQMLMAMEDAYLEGLDPGEFHQQELRGLRARPNPSHDELARMDMLLTDAFFTLAYQYRFGKIDPRSINPDWNITRNFEQSDPTLLLERSQGGDLRAALAGFTPRHEMYARLRDALAQYRQLQANGGWPEVPPGPTLRVDMSDVRVPPLRRRLAITGDLDPDAPIESERFDQQLEEAVKAFQKRHGLSADGAVGKATLAQLNVPAKARVDQLLLSLERGRWLFDVADPDAVFVNVAGFQLFLLRNNRLLWRTRVMVGERYRQTPLFRGEMTYLELNPTWTVPYSIATTSLLPEIRKDPSYLRRKNILVLDRAGKTVDPSGIDWQAISPRQFPYFLRQMPGPDNALGQVKFMFPNEHAVYLHDTPQRYLFSSEVRAFSAGCIRVEDPLDLADLLLQGDAKWDPARLRIALARGTPQVVPLKKPINVYIAYFTALVEADGLVHFWNDVYERDPEVRQNLEAPFKVTQVIQSRLRELFSD
jgi:murein L,D-transpeptidase YcbB/YkuD